TMDTTIEQQVAMDEGLVPRAQRCPFFKAFLITADVPEIYMQEFWATATVHHHAIRFKMDNKKHIVNLESFRDMLHTCLRVPGQSFDEPPFEEEILAFIRFLRHSVPIRTLTDININKLYQPWRSFAAIINKCLTGKSSGYDSLRLSQAQILWGLYYKRNVDYAYLMNSKAYKEYYAIAIGAATPKPKASVRRARSSSDTSITPPTAAASPRFPASTNGKQTAKHPKLKRLHISQPSGSGTYKGTGSIPGVPDVPTDESEEELSWKSTDDEGDDTEEKDDDGNEEDEGDDGEEGNDDEEEDIGLNVKREEGLNEKKEEDEIYRDVNINQGRGIQETLEVGDTHVTLTPINPHGKQKSSSTPSSVAPLPITIPTMTSSTIATTTTTSQAPILPTTVPSDIIQNLPSFGSLFRFDDRLRSLEENFSEVMQTNQFAGASNRLRDEAQRENDEFLRTIDENIKKIINEQVKEQVKVQVSKILPRIKQAVNEQLEAKVLTRSSYSSRTSYAVAADLSEMELKKILIEKIKGNKSIQHSDEQRNLYKALVEAYESDKIILDTYGETATLKRRRDDDEDKDEEPFAGPDRGSKRRREDQPIIQSSQHSEWFSQQQKPPTLDRDWNKTLLAVYGSIQPWISELAKLDDTHTSFNELMDTPLDFSNFIMNQLRVDTLTPELLVGPTGLAKQTDSHSSFNEFMDTPVDFLAFLMNRIKVDTLTLKLLAGPTYELMKGSCKSLVELKFFLEEVYKATTDQLD
nr:hypothetical protein [Tanacetum cinerariifolium]